MAVVNGDVHSEWDLSDFVSTFTCKSAKYVSPSASGPLTPGSGPGRRESPGQDDLQTSQLKSGTVNDDTFCTRENLDIRLRFLNQELLALGFPTIFPKSVIASRERDAKFDLTKLVNCTYELLMIQKQHVRARDDLEAKQMRSVSDNDFLLQSQIRLKEGLEQAKREISVLQLRGKQISKKHNALQTELKNEREETRKLKNDVAHKLSQFQHQTKRKEKEMTKLKERMNQLLTDRNNEKRVGIDLHNVLNSLPISDGKRRTWNSIDKVRDVEKMYLHAITDHEERHKELISENNSLRECLAEIQSDFFRLLNEVLLEEENEDDYLERKKKQLSNEVPFYLIKEELQNDFRTTTKLLKERLEQGSSKASSPVDDRLRPDTSNDEIKISNEEIKISNEEMINLKKELYHYRTIIEKQEQQQQSGDVSFNEQGNFEKKQQLIKEKESNLEKERKQLMEYAGKISKEREALDNERTEFYKYCISTPVMTKCKRKDTKEHSADPGTPLSHPKFHSSNPHFSPSPRTPVTRVRSSSSIKTPSTGALYSFLGLTQERKEENKDELTISDGSFLYHGNNEYEILDRKDSIQSNQSTDSKGGSSSGKRSRRVAEHVQNLKRALEFQQRGSDENLPP